MRGKKVKEWERRLKTVFDSIDVDMEKKYGGKYQLRERRPKFGQTANSESNGLFNIGAVFSAGYGSKHGRGYIVRVLMLTSKRLPDHVHHKIQCEVVDFLKAKLPIAFPDNEMTIKHDGDIFKIVGDLSLD